MRLLEARGLEKSYGGNMVLRGVDFTLDAGEAVAVLGENGAGKSTLARILAGATQPDCGHLAVAGDEVALTSPRDALRRGIAFIPQELATVPDLSVAENLMLGRWPGRAGLTSPGAILRRARAEVQRLGVPVDFEQRMGSLRLADQQIVEIVKALVRRARAILLDEPSSALTSDEASVLFRVLRRLLADGVGLIYISHRLEEVYDLCHRMDVLRDGKVVASVAPADTARETLIEHMVGHAVEDLGSADDVARRESLVLLRGWRHDGQPQIEDLDLDIGRGEVVGLFGVRGSGIELVAEALAGRPTRMSGEIVLNGRPTPLFRSPRAARRAGVMYVPPERKTEGLALNQSIERNLTLLMLDRLARFGFVRPRAVRRLSARLMHDFDVRASSATQHAGELSGGNQQKVLLASRLAPSPNVVVMHEPTRGVDIAARAQIHRLLRHTAEGGVAMLVVTSDADEAVVMSDRLVVMRDGAVVAELTGSDRTAAAALHAATGDLP